jgi:hypothetical protein
LEKKLRKVFKRKKARADRDWIDTLLILIIIISIVLAILINLGGG